MKNVFVLFLAVALLFAPGVVTALTEADCADFTAVSGLGAAEQTRSHSYTDRLACGLISDDGTRVLGVGIDAAPGGEDLFNEYVHEIKSQYSYCAAEAGCEQSETLQSGIYTHISSAKTPGTSNRTDGKDSVRRVGDYVLYVRASEFARDGAIAYPNLHNDVLTLAISKLESREEDEDDDALIAYAVGEDVEVRSGGGAWRQLKKGEVLRENDEIATGPDSLAWLEYADGTRVRIEELSQVRIDFLLKEGDGIRASIQLKLGKVAAQVNPDHTSISDFTVRTPIATASVRGTIFEVAFDEDLNTGHVAVSEGVVLVADQSGAERDVSAGEIANISDNGIVVGAFDGEIEGFSSSFNMSWLAVLAFVLIGLGVYGLKKK